MFTIAKNPRPVRKAAPQLYVPSTQRIKVSLHQLVNELLAGLQPLAMENNNVVLNGIPEGMSFYAEENLLAYVLWNIISATVQNRKNECIHIHTLVDSQRTMICVQDAGFYLGTTLAAEYRKVQEAAEKIGGRIHFYSDAQRTLIAFSITNTRLAE